MLNTPDDSTAAESPTSMSTSLRARNQAGDLYDHLETVSEAGKAQLARTLHDEMGGLLVGAIMDLAWAEQHWESKSADAREKLSRARQSIGSAVDLKRKLVERLRPSLLENVGLFAALRWHLKGVNDEIGIECRIDLPDTELHLSSEAAIMLFRSVQEAYGLFCAAQATGVKVVVRTDHGRLNVRIEAANARRPHGNSHESQHALAAIRRRILSLGGNSSMQYPEGDEMRFTASVPIRNILSK